MYSPARCAGYEALCASLGITKEAASRIDKALAAGQLAFKDVMPGLRAPKAVSYGNQKSVQEWKRRWRESANAPAARSAEELARTRALNAAKAEQAVHNADVRGVKVVRSGGSAGVTQGQSRRGNIVARVPENAGAALREKVYVQNNPDLSPAEQAIRQRQNQAWLERGELPTRSSKWSGMAVHGRPLTFKRRTSVHDPMDPTLLHMTTQHEIGEARTLKRAPGTRYAPHASHAGVEPRIREDIAMIGDPDAIRFMDGVRRRNSDGDDALVARLVRQVGGRPDSPIPLDSKRARALHEQLLARQSTTSVKSRADAVDLYRLDPRGSRAQGLLPPDIMKDVDRTQALRKLVAPERPSDARNTKRVEDAAASAPRLMDWIQGSSGAEGWRFLLKNRRFQGG